MFGKKAIYLKVNSLMGSDKSSESYKTKMEIRIKDYSRIKSLRDFAKYNSKIKTISKEQF